MTMSLQTLIVRAATARDSGKIWPRLECLIRDHVPKYASTLLCRCMVNHIWVCLLSTQTFGFFEADRTHLMTLPR